MPMGGRREGAGRPKGSTVPGALRREAQLQVKCPVASKARWHEAAERSGKPLSQVARDLLDQWADQVLGEE